MELIGITSGNLVKLFLSLNLAINPAINILGKRVVPAFILAVEMMKSRTKVEGLQQVKHTLELGLEDLVSEASRFQEKNPNRG